MARYWLASPTFITKPSGEAVTTRYTPLSHMRKRPGEGLHRRTVLPSPPGRKGVSPQASRSVCGSTELQPREQAAATGAKRAEGASGGSDGPRAAPAAAALDRGGRDRDLRRGRRSPRSGRTRPAAGRERVGRPEGDRLREARGTGPSGEGPSRGGGATPEPPNSWAVGCGRTPTSRGAT